VGVSGAIGGCAKSCEDGAVVVQGKARKTQAWLRKSTHAEVTM